MILLLSGITLTLVYFNRPINDFGNYYFGSKFALRGQNIHDIYEPYKFNLLVRSEPGLNNQQFFLNHAVVPPFTLLFFAPFTFTAAHPAKLLFNLISVFIFCYFLLRLLRHLDLQHPLILFLPLLFFIPFRNNILFGQTYLLLTGMLAAGFLAEEKNKNILASFYYSIAIALKISPAILLFYLLARKNFRAFYAVIIITTLFFLLPVYFTGWAFLKEFVSEYIPRMALNEINNPYATSYQSIVVLLRSLFVPDQLLNPFAKFNSVVAFSLLSGLCTGILFFFFIRQFLKNKDHFSMFSFSLLSGCLFTAYTSRYSLILLLPACIDAIRKKNFHMTAILILAFLICSVPTGALDSLPLLLRFPRLYLLLILFMIICSEYPLRKKELKWLVLSVAFYIPVSYLSLNKSEDDSKYFFEREISLLGYDFEFRGNDLALKFIDENGPAEKIIPLAYAVVTVEPLQAAAVSKYFGQQINSGNDHKRNPVLVNNKDIVYLSDRKRGIGFYALRKIPYDKP